MTVAAVRSYSKTTAVAAILAAAALLVGAVAAYRLPGVVGHFVAAISGGVACFAMLVAVAGAVVLLRARRAVRGCPDLFLHLNRTRDPDQIDARGLPRAARLRRWLLRRFTGHDLLVGDVVEVKSWDEIRATLDDSGCLEELPFMPEMRSMCGKRVRVFRNVHRLFDYRKTRRMRQMDRAVLLLRAVCDGSNHGGCEAMCHSIWKSDWLRRPDQRESEVSRPRSPGLRGADSTRDGLTVAPRDTAERYVCQLTCLHAGSRATKQSSVTQLLLPLISGNVALSAYAIGCLTYLFNEVQHWRQGVGFPVFDDSPTGATIEDLCPAVGDAVRVRSSSEIRATLNDHSMHRGLWFEPDMLKHCGRQYLVTAEIRRLIDIVSGELLTMKTPAYVLKDVHFSGERQLFNAQYEPLFWRGAWLRSEADATRRNS